MLLLLLFCFRKRFVGFRRRSGSFFSARILHRIGFLMRKSASNEQQRLESADWVPIIEPTNQEPQCRFVAAAAAAVLVVAVDVVVVAAVVVAVVVVVADGAFMERTLPFVFFLRRCGSRTAGPSGVARRRSRPPTNCATCTR